MKATDITLSFFRQRLESKEQLVIREEHRGFVVYDTKRNDTGNRFHTLDDAQRYIKDRTTTPIVADEGMFSPMDAIKILELKAADMINIKLLFL